MNLRRTLRSGVAAACIASVAAPAGMAAIPQAVAARAGLDLRVAQTKTFSRLEFHGLDGAKVTSRRDGQVLRLSFTRDGDPDISRLRTSPPRWIKTAEARHENGRLQLLVTLADDADVKMGAADGSVYVNIFEKPPEAAAPTAAPAAPQEPEPRRLNPVPAGGVVRMDSKMAGSQVQLSFAWANPAGAAVFRRGDAVWVVFDASANLDVSKAPKGLSQFSGVQALRGADYSAVRIDAAPDVPVFAASQGGLWTITLGPGDHAPPTHVKIQRDADSGPAALKAPLAGATRVVRVIDTSVGDAVTVVTALGPAKGLPTRRDYVQLTLLESAQGLAVETRADGVSVSREGDLVQLGRGDAGLALSPAWAAQEQQQAALGAPQTAARPAQIGDGWSRTGDDGFLPRYNGLVAAATAEAGNTDREAPVAARMALARFLVGSDLSFEAIGVLNAAAKAQPQLLDDAEFRGLRGVARVMARRYKEAEADFAAPVLSEDPSSALWRGYIAGQLGRWAEARTEFARGIEAFSAFSPVWKARFARGDAQAALEQGDLVGAASRIKLALEDPTDPLEELATRLVQARVAEGQGYTQKALRIYAALSRAPTEDIATPAMLRATQIKLDGGKLTPIQAAGVFDGLRYRWRGDSTELETIRALGALYLGQGRYREALEALRSAGGRLPDRPESLQLQADLAAAFRSLFLDGVADGLEPVQALALFFDFKELTPVGADGDLMVRKLVRRLVDVDLLPQAAELLKYQVDNRLDGAAGAQIATDLAVIYLMDRRPEQALQAINSSRTTILPTALNAERRLIEARAWAQLGRFENAQEIIERDPSGPAQELRAEIAWKQKNWAVAAPLFEKAMGQRWKDPKPLSGDEEGRLLRAGVAYSLAGDEGALARLNNQYRGFYDQARNPEALRIALTGETTTGRLSVASFGRVTADNEAFAGWVAKMKTRFRAAATKAPGKA